MFIPLSKAVAQAHRRLFPDEPVRDVKTLQAIALAFTDLMPIYRASSEQQLTEPELLSERFTESGMEQLIGLQGALRSRHCHAAGGVPRRGARQPDDAPEPRPGARR